MTRLIAALASGFVLFTSCSSGSTHPSPAPTTTTGGGPSLSITSPADGATVDAGELRVVAEVNGARIVDKIGSAPKRGEGHIVFYASIRPGAGYEVPTTQGKPANAGGTGYIAAAAATTTYDWRPWNLKAGTQNLAVQLVKNDTTPLDPPVIAEVTVTVTGSAAPTTSDPNLSPAPTWGGR